MRESIQLSSICLFAFSNWTNLFALPLGKKKREADIGSGADGDIIHGKLV